MKRKYSSLAMIFLSTAFTIHLTDRAVRCHQESPMFAPAVPCSPEEGLYNHEFSNAFLPSGGLGAMIEAEPRGIRLISVMPGHAASRAGIQLGDRITAIDGVSALGQSAPWAISRLRGKIGTSVRLEVERGDGLWQRSFVLNLVRENIDSSHSVYSRVRDGELTVKVLWLDQSTAGELSNHLSQSTRGDVRSVVLDLQNVSYGDVGAVADCASLFLPQNTTVGYMTTDSHNVKDVSPVKTRGFAMTDQLTAVKVGPYTARVGEMLAKALVSHLDIEVRGEATAGLGTLDGRSIRSRGADERNSFQLVDSKGRLIDGNPLKPSFWSWSSLLTPVPTGLD